MHKLAAYLVTIRLHGQSDWTGKHTDPDLPGQGPAIRWGASLFLGTLVASFVEGVVARRAEHTSSLLHGTVWQLCDRALRVQEAPQRNSL